MHRKSHVAKRKTIFRCFYTGVDPPESGQYSAATMYSKKQLLLMCFVITLVLKVSYGHAGPEFVLANRGAILQQVRKSRLTPLQPGSNISQLRPRHALSNPRFVLLRNGGVFHGSLQKERNTILVVRKNGNLRLKSSSVRFVGDSLETLYRLQSQTLLSEDFEGHATLANWCLRQGLLESAEKELLEVLVRQPNHPMAGRLMRHLKVVRETEKLQSVKQRVHRRFSETETSPVSVTNPPQRRQFGTTKMVTLLPPGALRVFTRTIQPLLATSCATTGCHRQKDAGDFQLFRTHHQSQISRTQTMHNLREVLQRIDVSAPGKSRVLTYALDPHGKRRGVPFRPLTRKQYQKLVDWIFLVTAIDQQKHNRAQTEGRSLRTADARVGLKAKATEKTTNRVKIVSKNRTSKQKRDVPTEVIISSQEQPVVITPDLPVSSAEVNRQPRSPKGAIKPAGTADKNTTKAISGPLPKRPSVRTSDQLPAAESVGAPSRVTNQQDWSFQMDTHVSTPPMVSEEPEKESGIIGFFRKILPFDR